MTPSETHPDYQLERHDDALHSGMSRITTLPTGNVTFLYTDIEGSTERWERYPTGMRQALVRHHTMLRTAIESHAGVVYQIIGDAFVAVFAAATAAIAAAIAAQHALFAEPWNEAIAPIRVRMALHVGQGSYQADGYHAEESLNRLARLLSASYGGQIVLTAAVYDGIGPAWPPTISVRDLGHHRLRDLTTRLHVWQVIAPGLPADFPPLRSLEHHPNNLPSQTTELYGRADEIAKVAARLHKPHTRQITLTGLGGIGKTRLALAIAADVLPDFPDGVYFVALDQVQDAAQVAPTLMTVLGIRDTSERTLQRVLAEWLQPKRLLLVLDNCEHVVSAMPLITELLQAAPNLNVLATSRVPLGVYGEQEHVVPPLPIPPDGGTLQVLEQNPAVQLFVARAQAVAPSFSLHTGNSAAIAAICVRLEGLPLAIELAAARARVLPPAQILARLSDRLDFLAAQSRDGPRRQQTLRATLEWSYSLLTTHEQRLLARLSVFVGGASLDAIAAVWEQPDHQAPDVVDGLLTLVGHSLVQAALRDDMPRYALLETVRAYAREQLAVLEESAAVASQHIAYFQDFAVVHMRTIGNTITERSAIVQEYPNIRAALREALDQQHVLQALIMSESLATFWWTSGYTREGWQLIQEALALPLPSEASQDLLLQQARAKQGAATIAEVLGEHAHARSLVEATLATARMCGDDELVVQMLKTLTDYLDSVSEYDQIVAVLNEALLAEQKLGNPVGMATSYIKLGIVEALNGAYATARSHYENALRLFRQTARPRGIVAALHNIGGLLSDQQQYAEAEPYLREALDISYQLDNQTAIITNLFNLGQLALRRLDAPTAWIYLREGLQRAVQGQYTVLSVYFIGYIGWLVQVEAHAPQAARLLGAYEALVADHRVGEHILSKEEQAPLYAARDHCRAQLGDDAFTTCYVAGQQMPFAEATALALEMAGVSSTASALPLSPSL